MTDEECKTVGHVFSGAIFTVRPDGYYDAGTRAKLIDVFAWTPSGQPMGLFCGLKNGRDDEETCAFDEFDVTWPDEGL